jgi:hypothetical protein
MILLSELEPIIMPTSGFFEYNTLFQKHSVFLTINQKYLILDVSLAQTCKVKSALTIFNAKRFD